MTDDLFQEQLIELARQPHHYGEVKNADLIINETNASCGDQLTLYILFSESKNALSPIKVLQWTGTGCIISQATMSLVADYMQNKKISDAQNLDQQQLQTWLGVDEIAMGRVKCLLLGVTAIQKVGKNS